MRTQVLQLVRDKYSGGIEERFGPTLAAEHLASEGGIRIDAAETLRRWMLAAGLWSRERKRGRYRKRRERKAHFGELVQLDGSFHAWLEERGPAGCLMNLVDDATGTTLCQLGKQETTWAAANHCGTGLSTMAFPRVCTRTGRTSMFAPPAKPRKPRGRRP